MPLPLDFGGVPFGGVPWWWINALVITGMLIVVVWVCWDLIPNWLKWPYFRGKDGFCYFIFVGSNVDDPTTKKDKGDAAGKRTQGNYLKPVLVFQGYKLDEKGNVVKGEGYRGFLGLGLYWVGLAKVVAIGRNTWAELKAGLFTARTMVEYGFSVKKNAMAFKIDDLEDADNIPFEVIGMFYWSIVNPEKAKRLTQDAYAITLEKLLGELVAWFKVKKIYRPEQSDGADNSGDTQAKSKEVAGGKKTPSNEIRKEFWAHLKKDTNHLLIDIEEQYGYAVSDMAISSVNPGKGFAELLTVGVKAELETNARRKWAELYRKNPELFMVAVADGIFAHGPPQLWDIESLRKLLVQALPGADVDIAAQKIAGILKNNGGAK